MKSKEEIVYPGIELELFGNARNWKNYLAEQLRPYITGDVLEVGAGLGTTTKVLISKAHYRSWTVLEPDPSMATELACSINNGDLPGVSLVPGTSRSLEGRSFDCLLYIDVLEHIEDDQAEVLLASDLLKAGGKLVILSPAWQFLYSPFDKSVGHYRRYSRHDLRRLKDPSLKLIICRYLDSMGAIASLANRFLLKQPYPNLRQVLFWDRFLIPLSRITDTFSFHLCGKSILMVWEKRHSNP